ncbi:MAG TPA: ADOP family duplicated permease [Thermoanaerobaculia bacterium]|nr:ADOP family duplicated permease [Thermoanaerobaculia bacterium]
MNRPGPEPRPRLPPRWLRAIARLLLPAGLGGDQALGDLLEDFRLRVTDGAGSGRVLLATSAFLSSALALAVTYSLPSRWRSRRDAGPGHAKENRTMTLSTGALLDLRTAARSLRRRPLLTAVAVLSLAIGLGATTAIFSLVNVLFLRPLPGISDQDRVVEIGRTRQGQGFDSFNYLDFRDLRQRDGALEELALWSSGDWSLAAEDGGRRMAGLYVTPSYFRALGVRPSRGRLLNERAEDELGERGVVVLSHRTWQSELGGDEGVIGSEILLNRRSYRVVSVTDPAFQGHVGGVQMALFMPMSDSPTLESSPEHLTDRRIMAFNVLGRLAPGRTAAEAEAQVRTVMRNLAETYPDSNAERGAGIVPLGPVPGAGRGPAGGFMTLLMALVVVLLCATCANVAGIQTARALARERELGTRLALGCGRGRLLRLLMLEALLLALAGGAIGFALATVVVRALDFRRLPVPVSFQLDLSPDLRVFGFCFVLALLAAVLLGLPAAWQASTRPAGPALVGGGWRAAGTASRWRRVFVGVQVAGASALALVAGLFLRSLEQASQIQTGFDPSGVVLTGLDLSLEGYEGAAEGLPLLERVLERVEGIPGVERAALSKDLPLDLASHGTGVVPESWDAAGERRYFGVDTNQVTPGYFETLRVPLLQGRLFEERDREGAESVAVVSRTFAERWPEGRDAVLGARFRYGSLDGPWVSVIGVVEDTKNQMLMDSAEPFVYLPLAQEYEPRLTLVARAGGEQDLSDELRQAVLEIDPSLSLTPVITLVQLTGLGTLPQRMAAILGAVVGSFALLLAGLGIYGVVAFQVTQRSREIGLRMALGEVRGAVTRRILRGAFRLVLPGLVVGGLLGAGLARLLRSLLLGLSPLDPTAVVAVAVTVGALVTLASLFPARRAASVDPAVALRNE